MSDTSTENKSPSRKEIKRQLKLAKRAEKKAKFLKKMKDASQSMRILLYLKYHAWTLLSMQLYAIIIFGIVMGFVAKIIWEIWSMIFSIHL